MNNGLPSYLTTEKKVGETPLEALERLRKEAGIRGDTPLAYAGRLDPMASGRLVILVGDTCKIQEQYHSLDKEYTFEVLMEVRSDTGDVLGIVSTSPLSKPYDIKRIASTLTGPITLPYPHFSSKTVRGKPLHLWTLEGRLSEIEIPTKTSVVYALTHTGTRTLRVKELGDEVSHSIEKIPTVTDERKELGADFRRVSVRASWKSLIEENPERVFTMHAFRGIASSGTYMRSLAERIGERAGTAALAMHIHRTTIGRYVKIPGLPGFWRKKF